MTKTRSAASKVVQVVGAVAIVVVVAVVIANNKDRYTRADSHDGASSASSMPITRDQLVSEIEAQISDGKLMKVGTLEVTDYSPNSVTLVYRRTAATPRMTRVEAEVTTTGLVKFSIDVLMAHGFNPHDHTTMVIAHAYQPAGKSVTGSDQVRTFGKSLYDYNRDKIVFEPATE